MKKRKKTQQPSFSWSSILIIVGVILVIVGIVNWNDSPMATQDSDDQSGEVMQETGSSKTSKTGTSVKTAKSVTKKVVETTKGTTAAPTQGPLSYSLSNIDDLVTVSRYTSPTYMTAGYLTELADTCNKKPSAAHIEELAAKFAGTNSVTYQFRYEVPTQDGGEYFAIILPNTPGYRNLDDVNADFEYCAAGGRYPRLVSPSWILFTDGCGGKDDGTKLPHGCTEIENNVFPTFSLN